MEFKKGNIGNYYLKSILENLGNEYSSDDEDILCNRTTKFNIRHICGNITALSYKNVKEGSKCKVCYHRGRAKNMYENMVNSKYNQEFIYINHFIKNKTATFFNIRHKNCLDPDSNYFEISMYHFNKKRPRCPYCEINMTQKAAQAKLDKQQPNTYIVLEKENIKINSPITLIHIPCGREIHTRLNNILNMNQCGCRYCGSKKAATNMKEKASVIFYNRLQNKFGDRFILNTPYISYNTKIEGIDTLLDRPFTLKPASILSKSKIPFKSKGEITIENFLINNDIEFIREYSFNDLKDIKPLKFDFYIPKKNILIEYDGEQHFHKMRNDKDGKKLKYTQYHDKLKNEYCIKNKIPLVRIKYSEYDNINKILTSRVLNSEN